jgi:hypothetical protein
MIAEVGIVEFNEDLGRGFSAARGVLPLGVKLSPAWDTDHY